MTSLETIRPVVSPDDVRFFHENGYLHLKSVVSPMELAALRAFEQDVSAATEASLIPSPNYRYATDPGYDHTER